MRLLPRAIVCFGATTVIGAASVAAPTSEIVDGVDRGCLLATGTYYNLAIPWCGIPYTPSLTFILDRIEFDHGQRSVYASGLVSFQVRPDSLGAPGRQVLTQGQHDLNATVGWQGADVPPLQLNQGQPYWIALKPVLGSQASVGDQSVPCQRYNWYLSQDGVDWTPSVPTASLAWMVRFYGTPITAIHTATWASVKALYQ